MAAAVFNRGKYLLGSSTLDWTSATIQALLVTASYTYDPTDNFVSDISNELTDGSYSRQTLGTKGVTEDDTGDRAVLTAAPIDFGALTNSTPGALILFQFVSTDADSPLISFHDGGFPVVANGAGFVVNGEGSSDNEWIDLSDCEA